jgi:hypothetical protein
MIELTKKAAQMMRTAVLEAPTLEVLGFGKVTVDSGIITITDVIIPPQEVGAVHTDLEADDLREWLTSLAQIGMVLADWPLWWHSHCSMNVGPSTQDTKTLALLAESVPSLGWFAGIVTNVRSEYHGWINTTRPVDLSATLSVDVDDPIPVSIINAVKDMMKEVRKAPPVVHTYPSLYQPPTDRSSAPPVRPQALKGLPDDAAAWDKWAKRFPTDVHRRLPDMNWLAINGLREMFGADAVDALLDREGDELIAVVASGDGNQVAQQMMRKNKGGGKK